MIVTITVNVGVESEGELVCASAGTSETITVRSLSEIVVCSRALALVIYHRLKACVRKERK